MRVHKKRADAPQRPLHELISLLRHGRKEPLSGETSVAGEVLTSALRPKNVGKTHKNEKGPPQHHSRGDQGKPTRPKSKASSQEEVE